MIYWKTAEDFYNTRPQSSEKPILLLIYTPGLPGCDRLIKTLDSLESREQISDLCFPIKVTTVNPTDAERKLINNHIFVASPTLQFLNWDGSRSHEFRYVPRQTRHAKGYTCTHNENHGTFDKDLLKSQFKLGLAKYFFYKGDQARAETVAQDILNIGTKDEHASTQAEQILARRARKDQPTLLDAELTFTTLSEAVTKMLSKLCEIHDSLVMEAWPFTDGSGDWRWYTDCVRELCFQIYQKLITTAQEIEFKNQGSQKNFRTYKILKNWHLCYRKLQADFIGVPDALLDYIALPHERSLRENVVHCIICEGSAHGLQIQNTLFSYHGTGQHVDFETHQAHIGEITSDIGSSAALFSQFESTHKTMLDSFRTIQDSDLEIKSAWWEPEPVSLQFRLDRLGWHLQDHICTHRKILAELNHKPTFVHTFCHVIFEGLAQVECSTIGSEVSVESELTGLISIIETRTQEFAAFIRQRAPAL